MKSFLKLKKASAYLAIIVIITVVFCGCGKKGISQSSIKKIDDLPNKIIGTQMGTTGDIYASDYIEHGSKIKQFNKAADAVMALKQGKVDCVIIDSEPAKKFVALNPELSILPEEFVVEDYSICIAKGNDELLEKVDDAITMLKEDGTLDKILSNYIGDETGNTPYTSPVDIVRSNGVLTMATNAAFEPYEYIENGKIVGIDADMAQAVADILGMNLVIQDMEFDSIITAVSSGKADMGVAGMTVTEDRMKNINFTQSYTTSRQVVIVNGGGGGDGSFISGFKEQFHENFIVDSRWRYIADGVLTTLRISFFAVIIGVVGGFILAIIRFSCDMNKKFRVLNNICRLYITIIRGTPAMIQLLIIYYVVFSSSNIDAVFVATIAFGLNSSAYIAEIVRSGLSSIDEGQFEAGRSLGFNYVRTMMYFILPQAIKNILPALGNEFIVLLKETSISGYIGIRDLTRGGDFIRSRTYNAFMPLIAVALIYLVLVVLLSMLVSKFERRLKNNAR